VETATTAQGCDAATTKPASSVTGGPWAKRKKERQVPATNVLQVMSVRAVFST
jgi:hypothetical protein